MGPLPVDYIWRIWDNTTIYDNMRDKYGFSNTIKYDKYKKYEFIKTNMGKYEFISYKFHKQI